MKKITLLLLFSSLITINTFAQNTFPSTGSAGIGTTTPKASALLDMESTSKGFLCPQMTSAQRTAIASPVAGLLVYQTNGTKGLYYYTGTVWKAISPAAQWTTSGSNIFYTAGNVGIGTTTPGDNLEVMSSEPSIAQFATSATSQGYIQFYNNTSSYFGYIGNFNGGATNFDVGTGSGNVTGNLNLVISAVPQATLSSAGNFGIGTTTPAFKLDVNGDINQSTGNVFRVGGTEVLKYDKSFNNLWIGGGGLSNNDNGGGSSNTACGDDALHSNTTGNFNTASGEEALFDNTTGRFNTATGSTALFANTTGGDNTAIGDGALSNNSTGGSNTACGEDALLDNTTGTNNIAIGLDALQTNKGGSENIAIGIDADPAAVVNNYTGIGYFVGTTASASNMVEIGNSSVSVIRGEVNFSTYSDERIKNNIKQNVPGLSFINLLKPVTYNMDIHKENQMLYAGKTINSKNAEADFPGKYDLEQKQMTGFLAQDVESAAESIGYDFSGVVKPQNENDLYSLRYSDFVVPMVKAIQELSAQNDSLRADINALKKSSATTGMVKVSIDNSDQTTLLGQNIPNPFDHSTLIPFRIPSDCHDASIAIVETATGRIIHLIPVSCTETQLSFDAGSLASGNYSYSLYVDGKLVETKQMVLIK